MSDDEADFDDWMKLPSIEQDRELERVMREHAMWWGSLTHAQQLAERRRRVVRTCRRWRRMMRDYPDLRDFWRENLRRSQIRLVAIRHERRTGIAPGSA